MYEKSKEYLTSKKNILLKITTMIKERARFNFNVVELSS